MKIKRAVKCAGIQEQLQNALCIAKQAGISGLEVQALLPLMESIPNAIKRGDIVLEECKNFQIKSLVYHYPFKYSMKNLEEAKKYDLASEEEGLIFTLTEDTIKEAAYVGSELGLSEVLICMHLFGFVDKKNITKENRNKALQKSKWRLNDLKGCADSYSDLFGCNIILTRENNPPVISLVSSEEINGVLDHDPRDTVLTVDNSLENDNGIYAAFDFAHFWQYMEYRKNGKGEYPAVDFFKEIYPNSDLEQIIKLITPHLKLIHMNDAIGYKVENEGLEIGKGTVPHSELIQLISKYLTQDIVGTYEIMTGHIEPECMLRSDSFYRTLFGEKFHEYFE